MRGEGQYPRVEAPSGRCGSPLPDPEDSSRQLHPRGAQGNSGVDVDMAAAMLFNETGRRWQG